MFAWNVPLVSLIFLNRSCLSHSIVFLYFFSLITVEGFLISPCYSLKLCIQMCISFLFSFAFCFSSFHRYFVRPPQTAMLLFCISFSWGWFCPFSSSPVHFSSLIPKMLTFTLTISCLTTSNLSWFMDLTFQVPMQYCSLQHQTLLLSPVTSTSGCCFCFGSIPSFFLELFLHWSAVAYGAPTDLGSSSLSILSFCLFILFMGFSRQECWSGLPFPSPVDHILSEVSTMICLSGGPTWCGS